MLLRIRRDFARIVGTSFSSNDLLDVGASTCAPVRPRTSDDGPRGSVSRTLPSRRTREERVACGFRDEERRRRSEYERPLSTSRTGFIGEEIWNPNTPLNEDCLYLNVWVTEKVQNSGTKDAPVMVWIYGGGYMSGTSTLEIYDGAILAASRDVIVASMNYRVGAFGFLCFGVPEAPCNQGLWDQAMALRWIQDNIEHFGGDSRKVTGFGESAGGGSVSTLLLSPATRHLLRRGILQSGTINAPWSYKTFDEERHASADLVRTSSSDARKRRTTARPIAKRERERNPVGSSPMRSVDFQVMDFPFAPTVDGDLLPKHPVVMLQEGDFSNVELIVGSNRDEGTYFVLYDFINAFNKDDPSLLTRDQYLAIMSEIFKQMSPIQKEAIIFQYTDWDYMDNGLKNQKMIASAVGDYFFVCPSNFFAQQFALGGATVYYYYFTWVSLSSEPGVKGVRGGQGSQGGLGGRNRCDVLRLPLQRTSSNPWGRWMGVMHGDEIDYVFGVPFNRSRNHLPIERALSERIMTHFARFAETGSPAKDEPEWPPYTRSEPKYYVFDAEKRGLGSGPRAFDCAFWNEFMPHLGRQEHALPGCGERPRILASVAAEPCERGLRSPTRRASSERVETSPFWGCFAFARVLVLPPDPRHERFPTATESGNAGRPHLDGEE
ncbi:unnamed protein product, partial [Darwinula stevensoni]